MILAARLFYFLSLFVMATLFVWGGNKGFNRIDGIPLLTALSFYILSRFHKTPWFPDILRYSKWVVIGVVALVFTPLALGHILKHWALETHGMDVAFVYSGLFYPYEWPPLWCTVCPNPTYLSEHFSPSLLLVTPLTALFRMTEVVLVLQSLLAAFVVWAFLYWGPIRHNKSLWLLAILYMVAHRTFRDAMVFDFREDTLALCGFSLALLALHRGKFYWAFFAFLVGMGAKEHMCFVAPFVGMAIVLDRSLGRSRKQRWLWACAYTVAGLVWMVFTFKWAMPYFSEGQLQKHVLMSRLPIPGMESSSAGGLLGAIFTNPSAIFNYFLSLLSDGGRYKYLMFMLLPTLPFSFRAWPWLLPALAGIGMNFISANATQRMMIFHYDLMVMPFLFFALLKGMERTPLVHFNRYAVYMVLWALLIFGRPPMHYIAKYARPAMTNFEEHSFLGQLDKGPVTAASMEWLAQIVHLKDTRVFYLPLQNCTTSDSTFYQAFLDYNQSEAMRSSLPFNEVRRFVMDTQSSGEACLAEVIRNQHLGHVREEMSSSSRFRVLTIEAPSL